jgi:hypothetical protein
MGHRRKSIGLTAALVFAWTGAAAAAAPRDAIRNLPILSHSSEISINSNAAAESYQNNYRGTWRIDWLSRDFVLPGATLRTALDYSTTLSDSLDKINRSSSDSREDKYNFRINLNTSGGLRAALSMDNNDVSSSRTPGTSPRVWRSTQNKELSLRWETPRLPVIYSRHAVRTTSEYFGKQQSSGSEEISTAYGVQYDAKPGNQPLSYRAETSLRQSEVYLPTRSSSSQRRQSLAGNRSLSLGGIGMLTLDYDYMESSVARPGELRATTNSEGTYGMSIFGRVQGLPLEYSYNYRSGFRSFQDQAGESDNSSDLSFTFTPPTPAGRSGRINLRYFIRDYEAASRHTTQAVQSLAYSFSTNPRTNGQMRYERTQTNDELLRELSTENEQVQAELRYTIPKGAGDIYCGITQSSGKEPLSQSENSSTGLRAGANFNLDKRSALQVFIDRSGYSSQSGQFGIARSTDNTRSGFTYRIASDQGLSLRATWQQTLNEVEPSSVTTNTQSLDLTLNYELPRGWRYQLNIRSNDYSREGLTGGEQSYRTEDSIQALMSYSF